MAEHSADVVVVGGGGSGLAAAIEAAVDEAIAAGVVTSDVAKPNQPTCTTSDFGNAVVAALRA